MPVGTISTTVELKIEQQKITRKPLAKKSTNFWLSLIEFVGINVFAALVAPLTGGLSETLIAEFDVTDFIASLITSSVEYATEVGLTEGLTALTGRLTTTDALINAVPGLGVFGKVGRALKTTRILKYADKTGILNKFNATEFKRIDQITSKLAGSKIVVGDKFIFDYSNGITKESLINNIGIVARHDYYKNFNNLTIDQLNNYLKFEKNINTLSKKMSINISKIDENNINKLLSKYGLQLDDIVKMTNDDFLNLADQIVKSGSGKNVVLFLNKIRYQKIYNAKIGDLIHKLKSNVYNYSKYVNPNFYAKKIMEKIVDPIREKLNYIIAKSTEKIKNRINKIKSKFNKKTVNNENKAILQEKLFPLNSEVLLGFKFKETGIIEKFWLSIYYCNPKYKPIGVLVTMPEIAKFAQAKSPMHYYLKVSGWSFGWGLQNGKILKLLNFAPSGLKKAVVDTINTYNRICNVLNYAQKFGKVFKDWENIKEWSADRIRDGLFDGIPNYNLRSLVKSFSSGKSISFIKTIEKQSKRFIGKKANRHFNKWNRRW